MEIWCTSTDIITQPQRVHNLSAWSVLSGPHSFSNPNYSTLTTSPHSNPSPSLSLSPPAESSLSSRQSVNNINGLSNSIRSSSGSTQSVNARPPVVLICSSATSGSCLSLAMSATTNIASGGDDESLTQHFLPRHRNTTLLLRRSPSNATSQVALVGSNICPIESLDYEIVENDFFKQDWRSRSKTQICQYTFIKWILCFVVGFTVSLIAFFNNLAVENIAGMKFVVTSNMMLENRYLAAFLVFGATNFGLTLFACLITAFIAPEAAGSGIPEVKAYLNGADAPAIFSLRTLLVKIVGSIAAVSASLQIGNAGPMVHTGACIAALTGQGGSNKYRLTWKWLRFFRNDRDRRDLVTCGSAAGIAAAFRSPVGGVLFALEEMSSWYSQYIHPSVLPYLLHGGFCFNDF